MLRLVALAVATAGCQVVFSLNDPDAKPTGDGTPTDGACSTDLTSDPMNCGSCGHSCEGGGCLNSLCQPTILSPSDPGPHDLALSQDHVFWVAGGGISRIAKSGGLEESFVAPPGVTDLAVDAQFVYWMNGTGVFRCPISGCVSGPETVTPNCTGGGQVTVSTNHIVNTCNSTDQAFRTSTASFTTTGAITTSLMDIAGVAAENNDAYIADRGTNRIFVKHENDNLAVFVETDTAGVDQLAIDGEKLYWTANNLIGASRREVKLSSVLTPTDSPAALAVFDQTVFFVGGANDGYLRVCDAGGCNQMPTDLATGLNNPNSVAVDGTHIYFITNGGGANDAVFKVVR